MTIPSEGGEFPSCDEIPYHASVKACKTERTPPNVGRDHNSFGFSQWLAGGCIRGSYVLGKTDDFGLHALEGVVNHFDYHATLLHLFGFDHAMVTFGRGAGVGSLTDGQPARVVKELLA